MKKSTLFFQNQTDDPSFLLTKAVKETKRSKTHI